MEFIILGVVFVAYVAYMRIRLGQTDSISRTVVKLPEKDKWLFTIWCWAMAFTFPFITPYLLPTTAFLGLLGVTIHYDRYDEWIHTGAAMGVYLSALVVLGWLYFPFGLIATAIFGIAVLIMKKFWGKRKEIKNYTYWVEVVGFVIIYLFLLGFNLYG
jgi:hypothetical protein